MTTEVVSSVLGVSSASESRVARHFGIVAPPRQEPKLCGAQLCGSVQCRHGVGVVHRVDRCPTSESPVATGSATPPEIASVFRLGSFGLHLVGILMIMFGCGVEN